MIHKAIAKPVRIRVKSCGEEHSTLDSLKHAFCVEDIVPLVKDGRLSRWLNQQGEKELAEYVEMIDADKVLSSEKEYVDFVTLFFEKEFSSAGFTARSKEDIRAFWGKDKDTWQQGLRALTLSMIQTNGVFASRLYEQDRSFMSEDEWKKIFRTLKANGAGSSVAMALEAIQKREEERNKMQAEQESCDIKIRTLTPRPATIMKMNSKLVGIRDLDGLINWIGCSLDHPFDPMSL